MTLLHLTNHHHSHVNSLRRSLAIAACLLMSGLPVQAGETIGLSLEQVSRSRTGDVLQATRLELDTDWGTIDLVCSGPIAVYDTISHPNGHTLIIGRFRGAMTWEDRTFTSQDEDIFYLILNPWGEPISMEKQGDAGNDSFLSASANDNSFRINSFSDSRVGNGRNGLHTFYLDAWGTVLLPEPLHPELIPPEKPPIHSVEDNSGAGQTEDPEG